MKNEDENRVKADVDNRADEDRAHRCAGMSLAADKGIQSDSQFNKYRSDKINRNIRGSISNRVVTCAEEIQKRCLKDKEKCQSESTEKKSSREVELPRIFSARSRFFCPSAMAARGAPPPLANPAKGGDDCDNRKRDADTGQCQEQHQESGRYKCGLQCYIVHLESVRGTEGRASSSISFPIFSVPRRPSCLVCMKKKNLQFFC